MKHPQLVAEERTVLGKKIKKLRREGILPGNVYGKNIPSTALQVKTADFDQIYKEVGDTGLIDLQLNGESKPVLVKSMQMHYKSNSPLHVDFYQVNLKEKVKATVPVVLIGEAKAVTDKVGMLLQTISEVEVEALPDSLPEKVEVSVEHLAALDDQLTVGDLKTPEDVTIITDPGQVVAKVAELVVEEEPEPEAPAEGEEGAEAAEGEEGENKEEKPESENGEKAEKSEKKD